MAQEVIYKLMDDLDGSEAEETVSFGLDGTGYEIDLNAKNAAALRKALDKYVMAARKAPRSSGARSRGASGRRGGAEIDPKAVRVWAAEHGIEVSSRGRIPADVLEQFRAAR
jgi:hypothetical protein